MYTNGKNFYVTRIGYIWETSKNELRRELKGIKDDTYLTGLEKVVASIFCIPFIISDRIWDSDFELKKV